MLAGHPGHETADRHHRAVAALVERRDRAVDGRRERVLDAEQRVVRHVQPEHLALVGEQDLLVPLLDIADDDGAEADLRRDGVAEQVVLPDRLGALGVNRVVHRLEMDREQPAAGVPERVERAGLDQRLHDALVADDGVDLAEEVTEVGVRAGRPARTHDGGHHVVPDVADRGQPETDVGARRREVRVGRVDVRRQHLDAHPAALVEVQRALALVVTHRGEQRRHVLGRIVGLEVAGPVRDESVAGRVRLVERVVGERDEDVP